MQKIWNVVRKTSPIYQDDNDYQVKTGNRIITNIKVNNLTSQNITPILNSSTPYIVPEGQIIQEEIQLSDYNNNTNQNNIFLNNKNYSNYKIVEIKLDDLIFIEGRLLQLSAFCVLQDCDTSDSVVKFNYPENGR